MLFTSVKLWSRPHQLKILHLHPKCYMVISRSQLSNPLHSQKFNISGNPGLKYVEIEMRDTKLCPCLRC